MGLTIKQQQHLDRLIEALESDQYQQCVGTLRAGRKHYCVGGVMCEVDGSGYWLYGAFGYVFRHSGLGNAFTVPAQVREHFGINYQLMNELEQANDHGATFKELATTLREWRQQYE